MKKLNQKDYFLPEVVSLGYKSIENSKTNQMQTIIGSGGAIGTPLAKELTAYTTDIRLVSRNPKKVNETDQLFPADLTDSQQIAKAIEGSEVVYVTIGFEYNLKVWQKVWPPFLQSVMDACILHGSKLVFFDNVYMYAPEAITFMTEDSPLGPSSRKGKVRLELHEMIMKAVAEGKLTAVIARAADFYGPDNRNSAMGSMIAERFLQGKKAQNMGKADAIHTFTFTPDAAKATALLGNTADTWNQVWHVPTTRERLTFDQWIRLVAAETGAKPEYQQVPVWMLKILGIFIPMLRELPEMMYQFDRDYVFDSSKFEKRFGITATRPAEGVRRMISSMKK